MQQHQDTNATTEAAETRVSREELAKAIAVLEARKQAESERLCDTVPIGQVLTELRVDAAPEEVLAEIISQRGQQERRPALGARRLPWLWGIALVIVISGAAVIMSAKKHSGADFRQMLNRINRVSHTDPATTYQATQPKLGGYVSINQLEDGLPFFVDRFTARMLLTEPNLGLMMPDPRTQSMVPPVVPPEWRFVKYNGDLYVCGWITARPNTDSQIIPVLHVYNLPSAPELGKQPVQITVKIKDAGYKGTYVQAGKMAYGGYEELPYINPARQIQQDVLTNVHLDSHAWEYWRPAEPRW